MNIYEIIAIIILILAFISVIIILKKVFSLFSKIFKPKSNKKNTNQVIESTSNNKNYESENDRIIRNIQLLFFKSKSGDKDAISELYLVLKNNSHLLSKSDLLEICEFLGSYCLANKMFKEAVEIYEIASKVNDVNAKYNLGKLLLNNENPELHNEQRAITLLREAADGGHSQALLDLANYYEQNKNYKEAFELYKIASQKKLPDAAYKVALYFEEGLGINKDLKKSFEYYKIASEMNHPLSLYKMGEFHEKGLTSEPDIKKAFKYYSKAAEFGITESLYKTATFYENGQVVNQDYKKAFKFYVEAAQKGHIEAQFKVAQFLEKGYSGIKDEKRALEIYINLSRNNHGGSLYRLGEAYMRGELGLKKDLDEAYKFFELAEKQGYKKPKLEFWGRAVFGLLGAALPLILSGLDTKSRQDELTFVDLFDFDDD